MSKDITEALRFYLDNNLDEVVSENPQNYFADFFSRSKINAFASCFLECTK